MNSQSQASINAEFKESIQSPMRSRTTRNQNNLSKSRRNGRVSNSNSKSPFQRQFQFSLIRNSTQCKTLPENSQPCLPKTKSITLLKYPSNSLQNQLMFHYFTVKMATILNQFFLQFLLIKNAIKIAIQIRQISKSHTTQNPLFGMRNLSNQNQNRISNPSDDENNLFAQPAQRKDFKKPSAQNTKQTTLSQTFNKKEQNQAQGIDSTSSIINDFKNCQLQSSAPASDEMQHLQSHQNLQYLNQSATKNEVPQRKSQQTLNSTRVSGATGLNSTAQNLNQSTLSGFTNPFSVQNSASKPQQQDQLDLLMFEQSHQRPFQRHSQSSQQDDIRTSTDRIPSSLSQQKASNNSNAQLLGQIFTNPQQVAQIEATLKETMSASDWNYVQILKKALRETVEENDKLLNKVAVLEEKVQTQEEKLQAQDRSIVELTLCLNNLMNGELVDGLFGNQDGDHDGDVEEVENQVQMQVSQQQNLQQQQQLLDQSSESDSEEIRFQSR